MNPQELKLIHVGLENHILTLTIANPPHNYLPLSFFSELDAGYQLMIDKSVHAVIITGGTKVFSKGADIEEIRRNPDCANFDMVAYGNKIFSQIEKLDKPVIAAISGACLGGGLELALCCHIRLCSEKSRIGLPEVSAGVIPGLGGIPRLAQIVGRSKALEMVLMGDIISAEKALAMNLVNRVFPRDGFANHVRIFTKTLLSARKEAVRAALHAFRQLDFRTGPDIIMSSAKSFSDLVRGTSD